MPRRGPLDIVFYVNSGRKPTTSHHGQRTTVPAAPAGSPPRLPGSSAAIAPLSPESGQDERPGAMLDGTRRIPTDRPGRHRWPPGAAPAAKILDALTSDGHSTVQPSVAQGWSAATYGAGASGIRRRGPGRRRPNRRDDVAVRPGWSAVRHRHARQADGQRHPGQRPTRRDIAATFSPRRSSSSWPSRRQPWRWPRAAVLDAIDDEVVRADDRAGRRCRRAMFCGYPGRRGHLLEGTTSAAGRRSGSSAATGPDGGPAEGVHARAWSSSGRWPAVRGAEDPPAAAFTTAEVLVGQEASPRSTARTSTMTRRSARRSSPPSLTTTMNACRPTPRCRRIAGGLDTRG